VQRAHEEERHAEHARVPTERMRHCERRDQQGPHRGEQHDADRALVGAGGVAEPRVPAPREPEHHQDCERLDQLRPARVVIDEARDLRDREDEHKVEEELERGDALVALDGHVLCAVYRDRRHR
jgi:hypothetical protein